MAGASWKDSDGEVEKLLEIVEHEKHRARRTGTKMNWKRISRKLNADYKNDRTEKACFWQYHRMRNAGKNGVKDRHGRVVRTPRPMQNITAYDPVLNPSEFWITAADDEGNIVMSVLVKNTAANVSRMLTDAANNLNALRDKYALFEQDERDRKEDDQDDD